MPNKIFQAMKCAFPSKKTAGEQRVDVKKPETIGGLISAVKSSLESAREIEDVDASKMILYIIDAKESLRRLQKLVIITKAIDYAFEVIQLQDMIEAVDLRRRASEERNAVTNVRNILEKFLDRNAVNYLLTEIIKTGALNR